MTPLIWAVTSLGTQRMERNGTMYAVIFEVEPKPGKAQECLDIAATLRPELDQIAGLISIERFESMYHPGKFVSLSFWRDEDAIRAWRAHVGHQSAQQKGRSELFKDYRIRVSAVLRDYGMVDRQDAPQRAEPTWGESVQF